MREPDLPGRARNEQHAAATCHVAPAVRPDLVQQAFGARETFHVSDRLHILTEETFQARKDEGRATGTAVKRSITPTVVPTRERSAWVRPEIHLIDTICFYNQAAVDQRMSPYLQTIGATRTAHFLGARTEWWF